MTPHAGDVTASFNGPLNVPFAVRPVNALEGWICSVVPCRVTAPGVDPLPPPSRSGLNASEAVTGLNDPDILYCGGTSDGA